LRPASVFSMMMMMMMMMMMSVTRGRASAARRLNCDKVMMTITDRFQGRLRPTFRGKDCTRSKGKR